jgi:hypothetical protein
MEKEKVYEFIGDIAICLYNKKIQISLSALNEILNDRERNAAYDSNRGLAKAVTAAYSRYKKYDPVIHHAIAHTFVDKDGQLPWTKYNNGS